MVSIHLFILNRITEGIFWIYSIELTNILQIGQLPELTALVIDQNTDIICIQEHRYTQSEDIIYHDTSNGWTLDTALHGKTVNAMIGAYRTMSPKITK